MDYESAIEWLFAQKRGNLSRTSERTKNLLNMLGNPENSFKSIHVVGTNGKGSVCSMLATGLQSTGLTIGRFTSPHLFDFCERISINGQNIDQKTVIDFIKDAKTWPKSTFFDLTTALAFDYFAKNRVDIAVIEAGVGAKNDPTINISNLLATVLTNVDLDHVKTIGPNLNDILFDKSAAIRPKTPIITGLKGDLLGVIKDISRKKSAPLLSLDDIDHELPISPKLEGKYQIINAKLAMITLQTLGFNEDIVKAALNASWPGRFERFQLQNQEIIIDGAHNPAAIKTILEDLEPEIVVIFAAKAKKDVDQMIHLLKTKTSNFVFTSIGIDSANPEQLAKKYGGKAFEKPSNALDYALNTRSNILITGSLYLVGQLRGQLKNRLSI